MKYSMRCIYIFIYGYITIIKTLKLKKILQIGISSFEILL